jgi:hypothetical protein
MLLFNTEYVDLSQANCAMPYKTNYGVTFWLKPANAMKSLKNIPLSTDMVNKTFKSFSSVPMIC